MVISCNCYWKNIFIVNNGFASRTTTSQLIENGGFETGNLTSWSKADAGSGTFNVTSGNTDPVSNQATVGASSGSFYAVSGQRGPGAHALGQGFSIDASSTSVQLSFDMFANNFANEVIIGSNLLHDSGNNQHARVDLMTSGSDLLSTNALSVIRNFFTGADSGTNPNPYTTLTFDISNDVIGHFNEVKVRFAQVDNRGHFGLGIDNVSVVSTNSEISSFITGGDGIDTADFSSANGGVRFILKDGADTAIVGTVRHQLTSIEKVVGSTHNDTFIVSGSEGVDITPGIGADTINLSAGSGADIIRYNTLNDIGDTIVGFVSGSDSIHLNHSAVPVTNSNDFTGVLPEEVFVKGASAVALDADDLIIFDTSNNRLLFDADANGAGAAVTIATFDNSSLIHSDITIF